MTENDIIEICKKYNIENYTINSDMSVDVDGDVNLMYERLNYLPLRFNKVTGDFECQRNNLITLNGCPNYVGGIFSCDNNNLNTLSFFPLYIKGTCYINNNKLTTLRELPINFHVGGNFYFHKNEITNPTEFSRLFFGYVGGELNSSFIEFNLFLNKHKNPPKKDLPRILSELRKITI